MAKIALIVGHPRRSTYCDALAQSYAEGAKAGGHEVELLALSTMQFDPILRGAYVEIQPREPELETAFQAIRAADHLVIIFPLWLGDMPALLKGFLERILQPEIFEFARVGQFAKVLKGKSARIVITMGMPGVIYKYWFGAHALKLIKRNILQFMGVHPVRSTIFGGVESVSKERREAWLVEMQQLGQRAS